MTPERLFTPPYGLSVGSDGTLGSRAGAGSRAPAGSRGRGHGVSAGRGHGGCESVTGRVRKILYERLRVRTRRAGAGGAHGAGAPAQACRGCVVLGCVFVSLFTIQALPNPQTIKQSLTNPQQQNPNPQHRTRKKQNNRRRIRTAPNPPQAHRRSDGGAQDITETFAGIGRGSKNEVGFLGTSVFWRHRNYASVSVGTLQKLHRFSAGLDHYRN